MSDFSPQLNEDQLQLQKWIHDFAENEIRPIAHEWDEREEFPYPIVERAAEIGLYGWEFMAEAMMNDSTGLTMPVAIEELFWGDAGIGMAIMGSGLAAAGIAASGTPEQVMEWVPQCYSDGSKINTGAFAASEPDAGSDVNGYRLSAKYDEAKDEWVLNGTKAWITNGGMADIHVVVAVVDPELGSKVTPASSSRPAPLVLPRDRSTRSTASRPATPPRSSSTMCAFPATVSSAVRRSSTSASPRSVGARRAMLRPPCRPSRPPGRPSAHRPSASPVPPRNTRPSTPRSATRSASRSS